MALKEERTEKLYFSLVFLGMPKIRNYHPIHD